MNQIYPDQGLVMQILRIAKQGLTFGIFTNNHTVTRDTVLADLTEAAWTGYSAVVLDDTNFTISGVAAHNGYILSAVLSFLNGSGSDKSSYGYFITDNARTKLLAAANFDSPPIVKPTGDSFTVLPRWGDFSQLS